MTRIEIDSVGSTNGWTAEHAAELPHMTMVTALSQTAGRGQRGNSWESEPGANLTFTVLARLPEVPVRGQFAVSEATALAVADTLADYGLEAKVKWPNDIYIADRKVCGILIEHSVLGTELTHSIIGVGLNVNQTEFRSDAPNPVSMAQAAGRSLDRPEVERTVSQRLEERLERSRHAAGREAQHAEFLTRLYRGDGAMHPYRDRAAGTVFRAAVADVEPQGLLHLRCEDGTERVYAFKEVEFVL